MQGNKPANVSPDFGAASVSPLETPDEAATGAADASSAAPDVAAKQARISRILAHRQALGVQEGGAARRNAGIQSAAVARIPHGGELPASGRQVRRIEQRLTVVSPHTLPAGASSHAAYVLPDSAVRKRSYTMYISFFLCVVVPVIAASIYYAMYVSNQYVTEFRFAVQDVAGSASTSQSTLLGMSGAATAAIASNTNYLVTDFLTSREAVDELQKRINVTSLYERPQIDWWNRFDASNPIEKFLNYWQGVTNASYDPVTGIATATVRAFTPGDALLIANTMVSLSEDLVNRIANRSATDTVRFAQKEVDRAEQRLKDSRAKMREYRNRVGVIDPTASVSASNSGLIQTQRASLAQLETQLDTLLRQNLQPNTPVITTLKNQIKSTKEQLARTEADVGKGINGTALASVVGEYEQINLEQQFAQTMLTSTMQALDTARANAAAQHLYITPYVRPSLPQSSTYPRRVWSVLKVAFFGLAFWMIGLLTVRAIRERFS